MTWKIPLFDLNYGSEEEAAVLEVLRSRWLSMGPKTQAMEETFAQALGVQHALAVTNCTAALELVFAEILCPFSHQETSYPSPDSAAQRPLIVVPDITFVATANAALMAGARVTTADAAPGSPFPGPEQYRQAVERVQDSPPAAIVAVHYAGFDCGIADLERLARQWGCALVEDTAHAIGAWDRKKIKPLGSWGIAGCFSFFSNKNLATGEGGLIATNHEKMARSLRLRRSHGMTSLTWQRHQGGISGYEVLTAGHNLRITEITAALALAQLKKLEPGNQRRRELWQHYSFALADHAQLEVPLSPWNSDPAELQTSACHIFPLLADNQDLRDHLRLALANAGIQTSHHYQAIHRFDFWQRAMADAPLNGPCAPRPNAASFADRQLTLPLYPGLTDENQNIIIETIKAHLR
jgi:dTDP-4-amino-4,6-dideoxygalactose transaminase